MPAPRRWSQHYFQFLTLRSRELLRCLAEIERPEYHAFVFRAAALATALAWQSGFPLLFFPELFRELAHDTLKQAGHQESLHKLGLKLLAETC
jgi:hypothetical protein